MVAQGGHVWLLRGVCMVAAGGGACVVAPGGMHGCSGGHVWLLRGGWGHAWLLGGACMVFWGCVVFLGGEHVCFLGGHGWFFR